MAQFDDDSSDDEVDGNVVLAAAVVAAVAAAAAAGPRQSSSLGRSFDEDESKMRDPSTCRVDSDGDALIPTLPTVLTMMGDRRAENGAEGAAALESDLCIVDDDPINDVFFGVCNNSSNNNNNNNSSDDEHPSPDATTRQPGSPLSSPDAAEAEAPAERSQDRKSLFSRFRRPGEIKPMARASNAPVEGAAAEAIEAPPAVKRANTNPKLIIVVALRNGPGTNSVTTSPLA